jgi:hypothetical protein
VRRFNGTIPPYRETERYVPHVVERYGHYRQALLAMRAKPGTAVSGGAHAVAPPTIPVSGNKAGRR